MLLIKKLLNILIGCICIMGLFSCTTTYDHGNGVVLSAKKVQGRDFKPHEGTKIGAAIGGVTGAIGGAAAGGFVGLALGSFGDVAAPILIATTLGGAVVGALIVGGAGAATGASLGYFVDIGNNNAGLYQFVVKPDHQDKPITIVQYSSIIPVDSRVHILEKDDTFFIKRK